MTDTHAIFETFNDKETAEDFADVLKENGIEFHIEEDAPEFDVSYAFNEMDKDYHIMVRQEDFKKARTAYEDYFKDKLDNTPSDYYLFSFTTDELQEILAKPDEWGAFDYLLAEKILHDRGIVITDEEKQTLKTERFQKLQEQQKEKPKNILFYYFISVLFFPVGIMVGWAWGYSRKTLPDGQKVAAYDGSTQKHGKIIFNLAVLVFIAIIAFTITRQGN